MVVSHILSPQHVFLKCKKNPKPQLNFDQSEVHGKLSALHREGRIFPSGLEIKDPEDVDVSKVLNYGGCC